MQVAIRVKLISVEHASWQADGCSRIWPGEHWSQILG